MPSAPQVTVLHDTFHVFMPYQQQAIDPYNNSKQTATEDNLPNSAWHERLSCLHGTITLIAKALFVKVFCIEQRTEQMS